MNIIRCHITNFGCYSNVTFDFRKELNSFYLKNGEGKTTLAAFIKAMFYSLEKSGKNTSYDRKHYKPYSGGEYGGAIEIELDGVMYRIERTFADTPAKDTLRIFDENGVQQSIFLTKHIKTLQGEASSLLGELIFGIDALSFQRCNFISSEDLEFSSSESIKMKIGNIVIDKEHENSYEDTLNSIEMDLRDKAPTKKLKENAYPYKINCLEKDNKDKNFEIRELNKLEPELQNLYLEVDKIRNEIRQIESKQNTYSQKHVLKGKMATVEQYNKEIESKTNIIDEINKRYSNCIPSKEEIDSLLFDINEYEKCENKNAAYHISASDIDKLQKLEGKIVSEDDYSLLEKANNKILDNQIINVTSVIDLNKLGILKSRFDNKNVKNDSLLEQEYIEYKALIRQRSDFANNYQGTLDDYPSENVLTHIEHQINEFKNLDKEIENLKSTHKEVPTIIVIVLTIVTFGFYLIFFNKNKRAYLNKIETKQNLLNAYKEELDSFFAQYNKTYGNYDLRILELRDDISKIEINKNQNAIKKQKEQELVNNLCNKKNNLLYYFSLFGYESDNVDEIYKTYKNDLIEYRSLIKEAERNEQINLSIQANKKDQLSAIESILQKYNMIMRDDFTNQLSDIKTNLEFYKKYNPIFLNKAENDSQKKKYEENIIAILDSHNIDCQLNSIVRAKSVINEIEKYNTLKRERVELIEKRDNFIKDNGLIDFNSDEIELDEQQLRDDHEFKTSKLTSLENQISQIETNLSRKESLHEDILHNNELIDEYKQKILIADLASKALKDAQSEMEFKYINPIKNSFISYATKMYEKIGANVNMDYDYNIKYDIQGKLRDARDLSDGERTIMMMALRFAVLDSMFKKHDSIIILDDPLLSLDVDKLSKAKELISAISRDWQIIYFTCHDSRAIGVGEEALQS